MPHIEAGGVEFHYQRLGAGDRTVVFLHGFVWDNLSSWYFTVAPPVAKSSSVLLYDLRGHGRSERPPTGYRIQDMLGDLDALLAKLEISGPVHLVGNSYGGLLAIAWAASRPGRAASLALIDANLSDESWAREMLEVIHLEGRERDRLITETFREWAGRRSDIERSRMAQTARELAYKTSLVADLEASPVLTDDDLRRVDCPVLAIYGENSDLRHRGERLARVLPRCELRLIPGGSHVILWEATQELKRQIAEWIEAL
jgi:pimeloyl-ACP methyl ester carboxylesterase